MSHTILLVEDDPGMSEVVSHLLRDEGYRVTRAPRGDIALSVLGEAKPDLIVSDVVMPGMSGFALCERVRADTNWSQIPFIFLTAMGQQADVRRGMRLGADDYVFKPFEPEDLLDAVQIRLRRAADMRPPGGGADADHAVAKIHAPGDTVRSSRNGAERAGDTETAQPIGRAGCRSLLNPALRIQALGHSQVEMDGKLVKWPVTTCRDIYFYLLQHPRGLRKEKIGEVFWPDHDPAKLDAVFRSYFYRLRQALFGESVIFEDGLYRCNRAIDCWYDVEVWEGLLKGAEQSNDPDENIGLLEEALTLYQGDYLEEVYADWAILERMRLRERYLTAMETLAGLYAKRRRLKRSVELYQDLLNEDSYHEAAHRELMRCYYHQGNRAAAIRQYWACVEIFGEELGLSPAAQTEELYQEIIT